MLNLFSSECYPLCVADSIGDTPPVSYCNSLVFRASSYSTDYDNFSRKYDAWPYYDCTRWLYRKVIAIPAALWTGVVKAIYHLARSILSLMDICGAHSLEDAKIHLYRVARDVQGALGCLIYLIHSKWGLYLIEDSRMQRSYYDSHIAARGGGFNIFGAVIHDDMSFQLAERLIEASQWRGAKQAALAMRCADGNFNKRDGLFVRLAEASLALLDAEEAYEVISQIRQLPAQKESLFHRLGNLSIRIPLPSRPSLYWQSEPEKKLRIAINSIRTISTAGERNACLRRVFEISLTCYPELALEIILEVNDNTIRNTLYERLAEIGLEAAYSTRLDGRWARAKAAVLAIQCDNGDYTVKGRWIVRLVELFLKNYMYDDAREILEAVRAIDNVNKRNELIQQLFTVCLGSQRSPFATTIILEHSDSAVRDDLYAKLSEDHLKRGGLAEARTAILSMKCANGNVAEKESLLLRLAERYLVDRRSAEALEVLEHVRISAQKEAVLITLSNLLIEQFSEKLDDHYKVGNYPADDLGLYKTMLELMGDSMNCSQQLNNQGVIKTVSKVSKTEERDTLLNKLFDVCIFYNHYRFAQMVLGQFTEDYRFNNWDRLLSRLTESYTKTAKESWNKYNLYFEGGNYDQFFGSRFGREWMFRSVADPERVKRMAEACNANFRWAGHNACVAALKSINQIKDTTKAKSLLEVLLETCRNGRQTEIAQEITSKLQTLNRGPSPYAILGVPPTASPKEIKQAYHKLAAKIHPDKVKDPSEESRAKQDKAFKELSAAYTILIPPPKVELEK